MIARDVVLCAGDLLVWDDAAGRTFLLLGTRQNVYGFLDWVMVYITGPQYLFQYPEMYVRRWAMHLATFERAEG